MIDILVVIKFPDFEKERLHHKKMLCDFILSRENFGNLWSFLEPKEKHSGHSSQIKGFKTWKVIVSWMTLSSLSV